MVFVPSCGAVHATAESATGSTSLEDGRVALAPQLAVLAARDGMKSPYVPRAGSSSFWPA